MKFLALFRFWSRLYVAHLEQEIAHLREQVAHERHRADLAVDELLRIRVEAGPITQNAPPVPRAGDHAAIIEKMLSDSEWATAGATSADDVETA